MQQKLTDQPKISLNSDDNSMKTPLPISLAVSLVSGICPSTTPVRNKRLSLSKEIKKKKDIQNNNTYNIDINNSSSDNSSSASNSCSISRNNRGDVIATDSSMSEKKKVLTINDLTKCPGCCGYFEESIFLTHSLTCNGNNRKIGLNLPLPVQGQNSVVAEHSPSVVLATAEEQLTVINSLSLLNAANLPSPISISDSADEDDNDECYVIGETENDVPAKTDISTTVPADRDHSDNTAFKITFEERLDINNPDNSAPNCSLSANVVAGQSVSAGKPPSGITAVTRSHYKKPSRPCPFCGVMQAKLTRHIQLKHRNVEQVREALAMPQHLQRTAFNEMKKEGIRKENLRRLQLHSENRTELIKERNCSTTVSFVSCPNCDESFPDGLITQHLPNCSSLIDKDQDTYQPVIIEPDNQQQSVALLKMKDSIVSNKIDKVTSVSENNHLAFIQGRSSYKESQLAADIPIPRETRIEVPSNQISLWKKNKNVPEICLQEIPQIQEEASVTHRDKMSIVHREDMVTLNFENSEKIESCQKTGSAPHVENTLDLNTHYHYNSLQDQQTPEQFAAQHDIQFFSSNKGSQSFLSSPTSSSSFGHFEEHDSTLRKNSSKVDGFLLRNKHSSYEDRNQELMLDDGKELYFPTRSVFEESQIEKNSSSRSDQLDYVNEERTSKSKTYKKPFRPCPFCGVMQAKLTRHIKLKHKNEERVQEALKLPPQEQRFAFNEFKQEGIILENLRHINSLPESVSLGLHQEPHSQVTMSLCPYCKGSYTKDVIWEHIKCCKVVPSQENVSNWLLHQEIDKTEFDLIDNSSPKIDDNQANLNLIRPPPSPLASSSSSLSISKKEDNHHSSFIDVEEKIVYACSQDLGLGLSSPRPTSEQNDTPDAPNVPLAGRYLTDCPEISHLFGERVATSHIKEETITSNLPEAENAFRKLIKVKEPENTFRKLVKEYNQDCHFSLVGHKTGSESIQLLKPVDQIVTAETETHFHHSELLPSFKKVESSDNLEYELLQENPGVVKALKQVDVQTNDSLQIDNFNLVPVKRELLDGPDEEESTFANITEMRAESPTISISDTSDEDCSIISSSSSNSPFIPLSVDQPSSYRLNSVVAKNLGRSGDKNKSQNYKKPSRPCLFCGIMQAKLSRHIKLKHRNEKRVQEAMQLAQPMQRHVFNQFKKEGIKKENLRRMNDQTQSQDLIAVRSTRTNPSIWTVCLHCEIAVKKDELFEHLSSCGSVASGLSSDLDINNVSQTLALSKRAEPPTDANPFLQVSQMSTIKDLSLMSRNIDDVTHSLTGSYPYPSRLEVKKENISSCGFENEEENFTQNKSENRGNSIKEIEHGHSSGLIPGVEPKYYLPTDLNVLDSGQGQSTLSSEMNSTSRQISYPSCSDFSSQREMQKESFSKDVLAEYDVLSIDTNSQNLDVGFIKKETDNIEFYPESSSLILISDSSDDETGFETTTSQDETTDLPSVVNDLDENLGCSKRDDLIKVTKGQSYKKPSRPCPFCGVMQAKLTRHIQLKHKDEPRVKSALGLPKPLQRQAFSQFKKEGIMKENLRRLNNPHNNEGLIPERLPPEKMLNVSCCGCGGLYPRDFISKHVLGCSLAVASLGLSTVSTMMVLDDSYRPQAVDFKSSCRKKLGLKNEWVLKMRRATSLELTESDTPLGVYWDRGKRFKDFQRKKYTNGKEHYKNAIWVDSFRMSSAIKKALFSINSKRLRNIQNPDKQNSRPAHREKINSCMSVSSRLLDQQDPFFQKKRKNLIYLIRKNLFDILKNRQSATRIFTAISVKKMKKLSSSQRSAACKGKFYKNIFRPISFCEKRRNKAILQKSNKSRPFQTFLGFSPPFHLKAFHLFKIKSCMQHNNERIKMSTDKQSRKLSQGNKSVKARRPLSKVLKYKKRYSSKEILSPRNIRSQKYQIRTKHQAIAKGNSALKGKVLYFVSSLASNKSRLLGNVGILDICRKGLDDNKWLKEHSMERRFGRSLKNKYLPREEFLMPDVTFNLENKISRFIKGKTKRRAPQPFASRLWTDVIKNRNGAPADYNIKTKLNISNLSESRNRVIPLESETQQSKSQKLPASFAFPEICFSINNSYHKLAVPIACQNLKVPTFPLKDVGSLIFTAPDNFYCFTSTLKLGDALKIEDKKSNNMFTSLVPALKMAGSCPPVYYQKSTRLENTALWLNKISQEIPALHGHPSDLDAINGQREEKVLHWAVSAFENEREPQNLLQKTTRISKTNWSEDESILLDEGIGSIRKRNGVVNGTATELMKGSVCHEFESIDDNSELVLPNTSPNVKTDVSFPMATELVKGSLDLELEDNTELLLPNTSPNLKNDVLLPTALTSTRPVSKESMSTVMINNKKQLTIVQASKDSSDESGRSNSCDGSGEFYGLDKLDHSRRKMPGGQCQQVESTLAPISGKDFSDYCYVLGNPNSKGHLGVSRQSYNFYESANKNGRSASGGNGSGGSGGGGSGGGGQMSSTQNSSRDGGGGGSGTTSGRNGTGSCSFGRGGSTNRKPPTPCPFCGVRQAKLKRHIQLRHKDEERVKKALQLPPNLQRDVFHQFKEEGLANERNRVKDSGGTSVSGRVTGGNRSSGTSSSSTATSSTVSSSSSSGAGSTSNISAGGSTSGRGTPTVGNIGSSGIGGTNIRCGSAGSSRGVMESSKIECPGTTGNIGARHDPSAMKVLCPLCDTYYEKDVLQMHMIGCSSALSHFNASDWLTGPVPLGTTDSEIDTDFLSDRSVDLGLDPNQLSLTAPLLKEEYEPPIASCSVGPLSSYKDFSGYMGMPQQPQQQMPQQQQQQQHQQHQQHPHPGRNFPRSGNSFMPNIDGCQQMPPNYGMEMGQNPSPGNAAQLANPYTVPSYHGGGIRHENPEMGPGNTWNQHYQQHQPQHHQQQAQQQQMYHHHQQQQSHPPPPAPPQHLQPHHQQQHMQTPPPPGLPQQQQPQAHQQRSMSADPGLMYMKSPKQEFPPSSSSFQSPDNFMLPSPQMGAQISDPSLHHRPPQLYSPNSGGAGKRVPSTTTHSPHDYGTPVFNSPSHAQMSPLGGAPGYQYAPHHQIPTMPPHSPSPRSCSNFSHLDEGGYQQMMPQHCMSDQGMVRSPLVAPHVPLAPQNRHGMMQLDAAQSHGTMMGSPADNNSNTSNNNNNNTSNNATRSLYLSSHQIEGSGNSNSSMAAANMTNSYRPPMYHNITPKTVSSSPNSSFHHSPVASPSLSSTSSSSSKNSGTYHYPTSSAPVSSGSGFSGPMYGLTDLSSASPIGDNNNNSSNCRLGYEGMGHGGDRLGMPQQGHQLQQLAPPPPPPPPPSAAAPQHHHQQQQQQQQPSLLSLQPLPSLMDNPSASPLLPSMSQMTPPRNHSASTTAASGGMAHMPPFAGGSSSSSSNSTNQMDPNCLMVGSCEPTLGDADRFGHQAGNMSGFNEGSSKDLADEISAAIDSHEDSSCGSSTTSGSGLSTATGGAEWNSCSGSVCLPGTGNNGSTPTLFTASSLDNNNASNSSGSSSCGGNSPRGYSKLRNYKKPARPCPFCGVMQAKLTRHIKLKHKEDKRVVEALRLPQPLKRQAFSQFKNEGIIIMKQARSSSSGPSSTDPPSS